MDNNSYQHAENTFKAIETILDSRLSQLKGDQTIVATVLQQDSVNKQKYQLSNAGMKFWAYTEDEEKIYTKNSSVYVLVPNGDFTQKKLIISQVPVEASKKTYGITNRFNQFIKVAKIASVKWSEIANGDLIRTTQSFFYNNNYDAIGITLTPNKDCNLTAADSFSIGIKFSSLTPEAAEPTIYNDDPIVISNQDLRGNPYNLSPSISYSFVYSCPELLQKNLIDLNYLQILKNYSENIDIDFIIDIWIGYTTDNLLVNTNQLKIYSNKDPNYNELANMTKALQEKYDKALAEINNSSKTKEDKAEEIKVQQEELIKALKEVNMTPRITYDKSSPDIKLYLEAFGTEDSNLVASPYIPSDNFTTIDVYRYRIGTSSEKLGTNWERVGNYTKGLVSLVYSNSSWIAQGKIDFSSADAGVFFTDAETTRFKIVCKVNDDTEFISSELIYYNANKDIPAAKVVTEQLRLSLQDGDTGIYNLYGLDNHLKNRATRSYSIRALTASGESLMNSDGKTYNDKLGVTKIEWIYPTYLTGIELKYKYDIDGNKTDIPEGALENGGWGDTFYYLLKSECYSNYTNNTINCIVTYKDGSTKEGSISLEFGGYGNRSTPYSLNIDINKPYRYITPGERVKLIATLERTDGVATALSQYDQVWTWVGEYDKDKEIMPVCHFVNGDGAILGDGISYSATSDEEIYVQIPEEPAAADYNAVVQLTVPKVQVNDVSEQDIVAYLPLPLCMDTDTNNKYLYQGPDRVVYDGINESSYDDSTIALYLNGQAIEIGDMAIIDDEKEISEIYVSNDIIKNNTSHLLSYVSSKEEEQTPNNVKLIAAPGTLINNKPFVNTIVILDSEENILWEQPIITFRNMWESSIYNWSGESPFTDDTGMYSPFIAAGKKESDNSFTGVMLGGVEAKASGNKTYGIFGTKQGKPRFYFTENGEAYIGNSDKQYGITLNSDGELEMILDQFYLNVPHMIIDSENKQIDVYGDSDNTELRARYGYIKSGTYGLDIYNGAFVIYANYIQDEKNKIFYTQTTNDGLAELYFQGKLEGYYETDLTENNITPFTIQTTFKINKTNDIIYGWDNDQRRLMGISLESVYNYPSYVANGYIDKIFIGHLIPNKYEDDYNNVGTTSNYRGFHSAIIATTKAGTELSSANNLLIASSGTNARLTLTALDDIATQALWNTGYKIEILPTSITLNHGITNYITLNSSGAKLESTWAFTGDITVDGVLQINHGKTSLKLLDGTKTYTYRPCLNFDTSYYYSIATSNIYYIRATYDTKVASSPWYLELQADGDGWSKGTLRGIDTWLSDISLKTNIKPTNRLALQYIKKISHFQFNWKHNNHLIPLGYVAQSLETVIPEAILAIKQPDGSRTLQISASGIIPYITKAIQELDEEIIALKQEIKELKQNEI